MMTAPTRLCRNPALAGDLRLRGDKQTTMLRLAMTNG